MRVGVRVGVDTLLALVLLVRRNPCSLIEIRVSFDGRSPREKLSHLIESPTYPPFSPLFFWCSGADLAAMIAGLKIGRSLDT